MAEDRTYKLVEIVGTSKESLAKAVANGVARASKSLETAESVRKILEWIWLDSKTGSHQRKPRAAFIRMLALSAASIPQLFNLESYQEIAKRHGITRANISRIAVEFQDMTGVQFRRNRSETSREHYRTAQEGHSNYRAKPKWRS